ncbi:hypothetical protein TNIN_309991 [Trichonephila inaurata madagascariensis]|uniref:Uncharacterized protein n=1 Tax=Trichonephila inaurata madagascariensis TaxID=2747483 RepID=A0A8X6WZ82_9ARAC|nr:hypothetical protein TNIN_309991 [Trichonephila inaurata madagascariensis]
MWRVSEAADPRFPKGNLPHRHSPPVPPHSPVPRNPSVPPGPPVPRNPSVPPNSPVPRNLPRNSAQPPPVPRNLPRIQHNHPQCHGIQHNHPPVPENTPQGNGNQ